MASTLVKAANQTKYDAGGSGDNVIANHQIKTVEKIWLDNYTLTGAMVLTNSTISIGTLPEGAILTGVEVIIATSVTQTSGTIGLGFSSEADGAAWGSLMAETDVTHNGTITTLRLPAHGIVNNLNAANGVAKIGGFQFEATGTRVTVALKLNNWTMTTGTLKTILRYT
jgi:hypothetical protein